MTIQTRADLLTAADVIYSETTPLANTANRVGQMFKDVIDSVPLTADYPTVMAVATSNLTLSGTAQTADSVALNSVGDTVLAAGQTTQVNRGPWVVQSGPWTRPSWFATGINAGGFLVRVQEGTVYSDTLWECTTDDPSAVVDTNNLAWQMLGAGTVTASRAGLAPAVSATVGAVAKSTGSTLGYETTVRVGTDYVAIGATVATAGSVRLGVNGSIYGLDSVAADAAIIRISTDDLVIGSDTIIDGISYRAAVSHIFRVAANSTCTVAADSFKVHPASAAVATTGTIRGPANFSGYGLNGTAADSRVWAISTNDLLLGDATNLTNVSVRAATSVAAYVGANAAWNATATTHAFKSGATTYLTVGADYVNLAAASLYFSTATVSPVISQATAGNANGYALYMHAQNINVSAGGPFTAGKLQLAAGYVTADTGAGTSLGGNVEILIGRYQATGQLTTAVFGEDANGEYLALGSGPVSVTGTIRNPVTLDIAALETGGADANVLWWDSDALLLGDATHSDMSTLASNAQVNLRVGANYVLRARDGWVEISAGGAAVAGSGDLAFGEDASIQALNTTPATTHLIGIVNDDVMVGDAANATYVYVQAASYIAFNIGANPIADFRSTGLQFANTLAPPTIDVSAYGNHAGTDLYIKAGSCNYGWTAGDLYLCSGTDGDYGPAVSVYVQAGGDTVIQAASNAGVPVLAFFGAGLTGQTSLTGARDVPEEALANLIGIIEDFGFIVDNTTAS